jgi:hypothetical protein
MSASLPATVCADCIGSVELAGLDAEGRCCAELANELHGALPNLTFISRPQPPDRRRLYPSRRSAAERIWPHRAGQAVYHRLFVMAQQPESTDILTTACGSLAKLGNARATACWFRLWLPSSSRPSRREAWPSWRSRAGRNEKCRAWWPGCQTRWRGRGAVGGILITFVIVGLRKPFRGIFWPRLNWQLAGA